MEARVFEKLCDIARREAGIDLRAGKEALVSARVAKRLRSLGLPSERDYLDHLLKDDTGQELQSFLDVISTNYTSFMRESDHFVRLGEWARSDAIKKQRRLRLWCAAAASGEEPYSIAITLLDAFGGRELDCKILATDISTKALRAARAGTYDESVIAPLSKAQRGKYLERCRTDSSARVFQVRQEVRDRIVFQRLNLAMPPFPMKGPLDVVFCRNVMIYFGRATREALVAEIDRLLAPGGILFTGHAESLAGIRSGLELVSPSIYRKPDAPPARTHMAEEQEAAP